VTYDFFNVISLSAARQKLIDNFVVNMLKTQKINIENALDKVLANNVISDCNVPGFNRSTVDGYALKCENTFGACESIPSLLEVIASVKMGESADFEIKDGQAVYVPTGAMLPKGSSGVAMIEYCEMYDKETLAVYKPTSNGENIIYEGEDIKKDEIVLKKR
jgi:molybdopterin molybdotransferase